MAALIQVETRDINRAIQSLSEQARKQVPFATALALTRTAKAVEAALQDTMRSVFDRPTPYITRGTFVVPATRKTLAATIGMVDKTKGSNNASPALYVREQFAGGSRGAKPFEKALQSMGALPDNMRAIPGAGIKTDRYGNVNRKDLAEIFGALKRQIGVFSGRGKRQALVGYFVVRPGDPDPRTQHLSPGVWRRINRGRDSTATPVFVFVAGANYSPRINLPAIAAKTIRREFDGNFADALARAIRTAR